jgi:AmmeMemoRadiSam system protein B
MDIPDLIGYDGLWTTSNQQEADMQIRQAVFAGSWYPGTADACEEQIQRFLTENADPDLARQVWHGGIVPHAGWYYSGAIACGVINCLKQDQPIDLVVIFGMHLHSGSPHHMMTRGAWQTPLGQLPVAEDLADEMAGRFQFQLETPTRFVQDNTIELQLPFVKYLLNPKQVLAVGVAPTPQAIQIGQAVADWALENGKTVKIIGSTDLTHYGRNYGFSPKGSGPQALAWVRDENDRRVIDAMLALQPEQVIQQAREHQNACCAGAVSAAVAAARRMGATRAHTVKYATSYDKSPGDSFVGYAGIIFGA